MTTLEDTCDPGDRVEVQARNQTVAMNVASEQLPPAMSEHARVVAKDMKWSTCNCGHIFDADGQMLAASIEELTQLLIRIAAISTSGVIWARNQHGGTGVGHDRDGDLATYLRSVRDASLLD